MYHQTLPALLTTQQCTSTPWVAYPRLTLVQAPAGPVLICAPASGLQVYRLEHLEEVAHARLASLHPSARTDLSAGVSGRSTESN